MRIKCVRSLYDSLSSDHLVDLEEPHQIRGWFAIIHRNRFHSHMFEHHVTDREQDRDVTDREQDRDRLFDRNATYFKLLPCASCQPFIHYRLYVILFGLCISSVCHAFSFLSLSFSFTLSVPLSPVLS